MGDATATTLPWGSLFFATTPELGAVCLKMVLGLRARPRHFKITSAHYFTSCYGIFCSRVFRENLHYFKCLYHLVKEGTWAVIKEQSCKHSVKPCSY